MKDKALFLDDFAKELAKSAGEKYRPSNGTEGEMFMSMWCFKCQREADYDAWKSGCCQISLYSMGFNVDEPEYPQEWQYDTDGQPICTAFEEVGR